jgi:hypothetical protein
MMGNNQLARDVLALVESWVPSQVYGHEREFQKELQSYLDRELNQQRRGSELPISREHGRSYCDVVVDDTIGIELKRNLSNSQTKKLDGQIKAHRKEYSHVIVCVCGIDDMDGWRRVKDEYATAGLDPMDMGGGPVEFVHKRRDAFGSETPAATPAATSAPSGSDTAAARQQSTMDAVEQVDAGQIAADSAAAVENLTGQRDDMNVMDSLLALLQGFIFLIFMAAILYYTYAVLF